MKNKKKIKKYSILALIIILISLCIFFLKENNYSKIQKIGEIEYSINLAGTINVDITGVITSNPNVPKLGAGMIPIKYVNNEWKITTADDSEWYDYSKSIYPTIMLSNGYYKSEPQYGIDETKQVAENNIGNSLAQDMGTIFVWIPRLVYTDDEIMYQKDISIVETEKFSLPTCFTYKIKNQPDLAVEGVWIEQTPDSSKALSTSKITAMNKEDNNYGLIKNEIVESINKDATNVVKRLLDGKKVREQQVKDIDNTNRIMLRVININKNTPIVVNAYTAEKKAYINVTYSDTQIRQIISVDNGTVLSEYSKSAEMSTPDNGIYTFAVVDINGNIKIATVQVGDGTPDFIGYKVNTTYIVMYSFDEQGNATEHSTVSIQDILKDGYETDANNALIKGTIDFKKVAAKEAEYNAIWYAYEEQKWANIVVRNNANEAYFTWIPRYVYKLDNTAQISHVTIVNLNNEDKDGNEMNLKEWVLPDAFTWVNSEGVSTPIPGFWITKYALSDGVTIGLNANVVGGINKIKVNNITNTSGLSNIKYDIYLYKLGDVSNKVISAKSQNQLLRTKVEPGDESDLIQNAVTGGFYVFNKSIESDDEGVKLESGNYSIRIVLKDSKGNYRGENWFNVAVTDTSIAAGLPDLVGFRINTTYLVTYTDPNNANTMNASIPISEILTDNYEIDETYNTLKVGTVDESKVKKVLEGTGATWFDYNSQKWANIVVRNAGSEVYYTWIPRYVYRLDNIDQVSEIKFISTTDEIPSGWTLPKAFTWIDESGATKQLPGYWITKYALSDETNLQFKVDNSDTVLGGVNKLIINNISCALSNITYKIYVYDHNKATTNQYFAEPETTPGEKRAFNDYDCTNNRYVRYAEMKPSDTKSIIFTDLLASTYDVRIVAYDNRGYYRAEKWYKNIVVLTKVDGEGLDADIDEIIKPGIEESVHTGFKQDTTHYVTYDSSGKEILTPLTEAPPDGWYDYDNQKWANIVTINNGQKAYFVYIPRYIYKLDHVRQSSEIKFVKPGDSVSAGWALPDAFKWNGTDIPGYWITKFALSQ